MTEAGKKGFIISGDLDRAFNGKFDALGPWVFPDGLELEHRGLDRMLEL